ncbi:isochorismatase-like protein 8 [Elsinoe australis]|uniref:Isochorismatase-like protein 8 n=1 Tax=Elsinoe australis TaxID=40998 RepID=A0A4U7AM41_9PEZI|nr:isochorismatase-like protein 8 [Elsinoe australis]
MASIFDMLTRQQPQFQTRQALIILGLQQDFIHPDGKLPVTNGHRFLRRIRNLVPAFRANGDIYWVRTENKTLKKTKGYHDDSSVVVTSESASRPSDDPSDKVDSILGNDDSTGGHLKSNHLSSSWDELPSLAVRQKRQSDPELYLNTTNETDRCCDPHGPGSTYTQDVQLLQAPQDTHLLKSHYSAFNGTSLLLTLRARLVTEIYLVGCMSNLCIHATALDAARHGIQINIVDDCLGYRSPHRHAEAIHRMTEDMGAYITTSSTVMSRFEDGPEMGRPDTREASPEVDDVDQQDMEAVNMTPFSYPSSAHPSNSSTRATRPTSAEDQLSPLHPPQSEIIVPEYVASSCALGHGEQFDDEALGMAADDEHSQKVSGNMDAIRSIERIDTHARTDEWRKSCSPVDDPADAKQDQEQHFSSALADLASSQVIQKESTPDSAEGRTSKKRRSADLDDYDLGLGGLDVSKDDTGSKIKKATDAQPVHKKTKCIPSLANFPLKKPGDHIGVGDTTISCDLLTPAEADKAFNTILSEVPWQRMSHVTGDVPRLVCCQGTIASDGSMPIYRHPSDSSLPLLHWSPSVDRIRRLAKHHVGHPLNHALIQLYRSGQDHISEHSDKTLDIVPDSKIVNVSLGAQRTMRLRSKRMRFPPTYSALSSSPPIRPQPHPQAQSSPPSVAPIPQPSPPEPAGRDTQRAKSMPPSLRTIFDKTIPHEGTMPARTTERIALPHGSILAMGLETNAHFLHGIQPDKRRDGELSLAEKAFGGVRVSLTFRHIGTWLDAGEGGIWGVGATAKEQGGKGRVLNGDGEEGRVAAEELLRMFGRENQGAGLTREEVYGAGSDVLHLKTGGRKEGVGILFLSGEEAGDESVRAYLGFLGREAEVLLPVSLGMEKVREWMEAEGRSVDVPREEREVVLRDEDEGHTEVRGAAAVLKYLDMCYGEQGKARGQVARECELLCSLEGLRELVRKGETGDVENIMDGLERGLEMGGEEWLAGKRIGATDFGYAPIVKRTLLQESMDSFPCLSAWLDRMNRVLEGHDST